MPWARWSVPGGSPRCAGHLELGEIVVADRPQRGGQRVVLHVGGSAYSRARRDAVGTDSTRRVARAAAHHRPSSTVCGRQARCCPAAAYTPHHQLFQAGGGGCGIVSAPATPPANHVRDVRRGQHGADGRADRTPANIAATKAPRRLSGRRRSRRRRWACKSDARGDAVNG